MSLVRKALKKIAGGTLPTSLTGVDYSKTPMGIVTLKRRASKLRGTPAPKIKLPKKLA